MSRDADLDSTDDALRAYVFSAPESRFRGEWRFVTPSLPVKEESSRQDDFYRQRFELPSPGAFNGALPLARNGTGRDIE